METLNCHSDPLMIFFCCQMLLNCLEYYGILFNSLLREVQLIVHKKKGRFLCLNCLDVFCILRVKRMGTISEGAVGIFMFLYFLILGFKFSDHFQAFMFDCNKLPSALFLDISVSRQAR